MKILLTGAHGQLGHELQRALAPLGPVVAWSRVDCDLTQFDQLRTRVRELQPQVMVNAAAYTAVDQAERELEQVHALNARVPAVLAEEAASLGAWLVHYSTDYVFDGTRQQPYIETAAPHPLNAYGLSKWLGEQAVARSGARHLILRTSWLYGVHGHNFVKTILRLAAQREVLDVVNDQHGAPTSAAWVADATAQMLSQCLEKNSDDGLYHLSAQGCTTWYEFAHHILTAAEDAGLHFKLKASGVHTVSSAQYSAPAPRPAWSLLDTHKLTQTFGITPPHWRAALAPVLEQLFYDLLHQSH